MAKQKLIGEAGVDTGNLLIVDPGYLFTKEEWFLEVVGRVERLGIDYPQAALQALGARTGINMEKLAVIANTGGDGSFPVHETGSKIVIG